MKLGLIEVNSDLAGVQEWVGQRMGTVAMVGVAGGTLHNFIVEPFVPHQQSQEFYIWLVCGSKKISTANYCVVVLYFPFSAS